MTAKVLIAAIAAAVAVGAVSGAMATIPDGAGVIHGCYSTLPAISTHFRPRYFPRLV